MKKSDLSQYSKQELIAELGRRSELKNGDHSRGHSPMYGAEMAIEAVGNELNRCTFGAWLREQESRETTECQPCPRCGRRVPVRATKRPRTLHALDGIFRYTRNYHYCDHCRRGFYPLDERVGAPPDGEASDGLSERAMDFAINAPYGEASERFEMHYGRAVSTHLLRCIVERIPLPEFQAQPGISDSERVTVQIDGSQLPMQVGWKEAKVGVVVAQEHHSPGSQHARGQISEANYIATMGAVREFEDHLSAALPPRPSRAERLAGRAGPEVVWVGDGAPWIWNMQQRLCPNSIGILDWVHAVEHGADCGKVVLNEDPDCCALWQQRIESLLANGDIKTLLTELRECQTDDNTAEQAEHVRKLIKYYTINASRMDYPTHRAAGRVIGSGIVESSHRHVLQTRMKKAGQHGSMQGAEKMARLRAVYRTVGPKRFYQRICATNQSAQECRLAA